MDNEEEMRIRKILQRLYMIRKGRKEREGRERKGEEGGKDWMTEGRQQKRGRGRERKEERTE